MFGPGDKLSIGEQLYSAKGAQSAGISEYIRGKLDLDINREDDTFIVETKSNKWGNRFFELQLAWAVSQFGNFQLRDHRMNQAHDMLVSIPLYCKIAGISMNEIYFEEYYIKLKPEYNKGPYDWILYNFTDPFRKMIGAHSSI